MGFLSPITMFFKRWGRRIFDREERRNYLAAEGSKIIVIIVYTLLSLLLFAEAMASKFDLILLIYSFVEY